MADLKQHMSQHLRSARHWLVQAEESFDKDSAVRGELNLLLAQAELQRVRESHSPWRWTLWTQGVAFLLSLVVAATGIGGYFWFSHDREGHSVAPLAASDEVLPVFPVQQKGIENVVQLEQVAVPLVPEKEVQAEMSAAQPEQHSAPVHRTKTEPLSPERGMAVSHVSEQQELLSVREKQNLIRQAGQLLRGKQ